MTAPLEGTHWSVRRLGVEQQRLEYRTGGTTDEEFAREQCDLTAFADALRRLCEVSVWTIVDRVTIREARARVEAVTSMLSEAMVPADFSVVVTNGGHARGYGNPVVERRNPIAPPITVVQDPATGSASAEFFLNSLYEGPPGKVHGGVLALVLDQVFGEATQAARCPGMTGTLTLRYHRPTALGACSAKAWVEKRNGIKTIVRGWMKDAAGQVTVEAEGLFVLPKLLRPLWGEGDD